MIVYRDKQIYIYLTSIVNEETLAFSSLVSGYSMYSCLWNSKEDSP